jgi:hypothetical protein
MVPSLQSHAEILSAASGDDRAQRIGHIQDELARRSHPAGALTPVCFTALAASASATVNRNVVTFVTHTGKSLQVLLDLPAEKARAFRADLVGLLRSQSIASHARRAS